jgi:hypothetical protein
MTAWRRVIELSIDDADAAKLMSIARSRTEPASWVERANWLAQQPAGPSLAAKLSSKLIQPPVEVVVSVFLRSIVSPLAAKAAPSKKWKDAPRQKLSRS